MKSLLIISLLFIGISSHAQENDTTFWSFAADFTEGQVGTLEHSWGRESVRYLGTIQWKTPGGKVITFRVITSYRQITEANGFNDQSVLALVKSNHQMGKAYDMVKRQNLPLAIRDDQLVYKPDGSEILSALPARLAERFCVQGMTCYNEMDATKVAE